MEAPASFNLIDAAREWQVEAGEPELHLNAIDLQPAPFPAAVGSLPNRLKIFHESTAEPALANMRMIEEIQEVRALTALVR